MNTGHAKIVSGIWEIVFLYWCVCILRSWVLLCAVPQSWGSWRRCCTCSTYCSPKIHNSTIPAARVAPENTSTSPLIPGWLGYRPWAIQKVPDLFCSAQQLLEYETISLRCNQCSQDCATSHETQWLMSSKTVHLTSTHHKASLLQTSNV